MKKFSVHESKPWLPHSLAAINLHFQNWKVLQVIIRNEDLTFSPSGFILILNAINVEEIRSVHKKHFFHDKNPNKKPKHSYLQFTLLYHIVFKKKKKGKFIIDDNYIFGLFLRAFVSYQNYYQKGI